ncbi:hypothetical protein ACE6ED_17270 [Paenibacillus sp. CN-4]|uniref:hypothetical protein n=1 Tax=Paenibacillus nanchangensis TaxID=3348343 RepID=UPI00397B114B
MNNMPQHAATCRNMPLNVPRKGLLDVLLHVLGCHRFDTSSLCIFLHKGVK